MPRRPNTSPQTLSVIAAFAENPRLWRHGYDLSVALKLGSGTLYPLLKRLAEQGYLEGAWRPAIPPGKPPRHMYRLSERGVALAQAQAEAGKAREPA